MAIIKCKMCGDIILSEDQSYGTCEYCGSTMTFPKVSDEQRLNLFNRANHFRRQNEFDKAIAAYDKILDQDDTDAEAHWGAVLSRYGIEYVEDPITHERIPTCHRVQLGSILTDADYLAALEHAPDAASRGIYEKEAKRIAEIQKGILAISSQEKPYDVFICYKETDDNGSRTKDSTLAQDIYYQLTNEGFKVFFSRITLEDKLGQQYEPYIFAALNSAKVMLVIGTKPENFNAVWVKNEWSRYLDLMKRDRNKLLIPCYRDMDPYDLPEELSALQSQDMSKIGFMQDLIRGIKKVLQREESKAQVIVQQNMISGGANIDNLMKRAQLFLEDGNWASATEYLDKILDENAEYAPAYAGKVQAMLKIRRQEDLASSLTEYEKSPDWHKAMRFATLDQRKVYEGYVAGAMEVRETHRKQGIYDQAQQAIEMATTPDACERARTLYESISGFKDADSQIQTCREKAERIKYTNAYERAIALRGERACEKVASEWEALANTFEGITWQDAVQRADQCREAAEKVREQAYAEAIQKLESAETPQDCDNAKQRLIELGLYRDATRQADCCDQKKAQLQVQINAKNEASRKRVEAQAKAVATKWRNRTIRIFALITAIAAGATLYVKVIKPNSIYNTAVTAMKAGQYDDAIVTFKILGDYKDAATQVVECQYQKGVTLLASGNYDDASTTFGAISEYKDAATQVLECQYQKGVALLALGNYDDASTTFGAISEYKDAATQVVECQYQKGVTLLASGNYDDASTMFGAISEYKDAATQALESIFQKALAQYQNGDYDASYHTFSSIPGYNGVNNLLATDDNLIAAAERAAYLAQFDIGKTVAFGHYEQNNNIEDGVEEIEWQVLSNDGECATLISVKALDSKPYNTEYTPVTWQTCSLRKWLNGDFLNTAFSPEEQAQLETVEVNADRNPKERTDPGNNTHDKVYLISINEANSFFSSDQDRICYPTVYAEVQGAITNDTGACWWWLRSPGCGSCFAAYVCRDGSVSNHGDCVDVGSGNPQRVRNVSNAVRPVVVLRISSDMGRK